MTIERWSEPGRSVHEDGRIVYAWPPVGRFAALWDEFDSQYNDREKHELLALLKRWRDAESTLVAYTDPQTGEWVDVEADWTEPERWLR